MDGQRSRLRVVFVATAVLVGACGKLGYDREGLESGAGGSAGGAVVATGSGGALGTFDATGTGGVGFASGGAGGSGGAGAGGSFDADADASAGGSNGAVDASDDAIASTCDYTASPSLLYRHYSDLNGQINVGFKLVNGSARSLALRDYKVRYFLTNELRTPTASIVYGDDCCPDRNVINHVSAVVVAMNPPAANADTYIEVSFDALSGNLNPGHAVEVEVELRGAELTLPVQANDYSYIATASGTQLQWDSCPASRNCNRYHTCTMTVLANGILVWGYPP